MGAATAFCPSGAQPKGERFESQAEVKPRSGKGGKDGPGEQRTTRVKAGRRRIERQVQGLGVSAESAAGTWKTKIAETKPGLRPVAT